MNKVLWSGSYCKSNKQIKVPPRKRKFTFIHTEDSHLIWFWKNNGEQFPAVLIARFLLSKDGAHTATPPTHGMMALGQPARVNEPLSAPIQITPCLRHVCQKKAHIYFGIFGPHLLVGHFRLTTILSGPQIGHKWVFAVWLKAERILFKVNGTINVMHNFFQLSSLLTDQQGDQFGRALQQNCLTTCSFMLFKCNKFTQIYTFQKLQ